MLLPLGLASIASIIVIHSPPAASILDLAVLENFNAATVTLISKVPLDKKADKFIEFCEEGGSK